VFGIDPFGGSDPVVHPEDRDPPDESGPWIPLLIGAAVVWVPLALADWRLLTDGTFLWATVRTVATLLVAPLSAAALLQDTRALGVAGIEVGRPKWVYALVAVVFPPVAAVYLLHRRWLRRRIVEGTVADPGDAGDVEGAADTDSGGPVGDVGDPNHADDPAPSSARKPSSSSTGRDVPANDDATTRRE
jgi:hypothetical protein